MRICKSSTAIEQAIREANVQRLLWASSSTKDPHYVASIDLESSCRDQAIAQLLDLQRRMGEYAQIDGRVGEDEFFYAEQNARLIKNAEEYYRSMFQGRVNSWNLRDRHMAETLEQLMAHLDRHGGCTKVVVWEHNSHLGDARATEMGDRGEWKVGQLVREHYGQEAILVGFTTYAGTVTAAHNWGDLPQLKQVRPALPDSYESLFHQVQIPQFLLNLQGDNAAISGLQERRLERAIGVIYQPKTERSSHYFYVSLPRQFDAVIHWDQTQGVEPLDRMTQEESHEAPETFPSAL